jgi:hypothetical protein
LKKKREPVEYNNNRSIFRFLTVSQDERLVVATTDKETRKSFGFALFDAKTFEPLLFDAFPDNLY